MSDGRTFEITESDLRDRADRLRDSARDIEVIEAFVGGVAALDSKFGMAAKTANLAEGVRLGLIGVAHELEALVGGEGR